MEEAFILQCHQCFKILDNQPNKNAIGPDHVICPKCGARVPTPFIPWIEISFWRKLKLVFGMFIAVSGGIHAAVSFVLMPVLKGWASLFTETQTMFSTPEVFAVAYIYIPIFSGLMASLVMCRQYREQK